MRFLGIIDNKINKDEALALYDDYAEFMESVLGMPVQYWVERKDFTNVPTTPDSDGDLKPTFGYRHTLATDVHKRYGDYGVDDIIMQVHEDNFLYKGIWGTAYSYVHYKYNFLLCRWDKDNAVNTFNTLFHEGMHPANTVLEKELKLNINTLVRDWILAGNTTKEDIVYVRANGFDWDRDYVHGRLPSVQYIGRRGYERNEANLRILRFVAPYLRQAYQKRKAAHFSPVTAVMRRLVAVLQNKLKNLL